MKVIQTNQISPRSLKTAEKDWVYNGLDCCITYEVLDALLPQLNRYTERTYHSLRTFRLRSLTCVCVA